MSKVPRKALLSQDPENPESEDEEDDDDEEILCEMKGAGEQQAHAIELAADIDSAVVLYAARTVFTQSGWIMKFRLSGLVILWAISLYIQCVVSFYMIPAICQDEYAQKIEEHQLFKRWRESGSGGNGLESNSSMIRAQKICTGQEWSWQESVVDHLKNYNDMMTIFMFFPISKGRFFGLMAIFIWACTVTVQFRKWSSFCLLLFVQTPRRTSHLGSPRVDESDETQWHKNGVKASVAAVALVRAFTTVSLVVYGTQFLAHTDNLKDFILNSVSLAFVFELPTLVFAAFSPVDTAQEIVKANEKWAQEHQKIMLSALFAHLSGPLCVLLTTFIMVYGCGLLFRFSNELDETVFRQLCATVPGVTTDIL